GGTSLSVFNASKHALTPIEEQMLLDYVLESADRGFPLTHRNIQQFANVILKGNSSEMQCIGKNW
ncbi:hypothetical protein M422DRAFT_135986, partial [Sphaerobolus stellatus SS14]